MANTHWSYKNYKENKTCLDTSLAITVILD